MSKIKWADWQLRRRRCNAHCKQPPLRYCKNWAVRGRTRCKFHGGMSTGPKTPEGKARVVAAMVEGRRRWLARLKAEGKPFPGGRKPGSRIAKPPKVMAAAAKPTPAVRLPKKYQHLTYDEFIEMAKKALGQLQERLDARPENDPAARPHGPTPFECA
jgi:hypothetical protein